MIYQMNTLNRLDNWVNEIGNNCKDNVSKMIACNKIDLISEENDWMITKDK